MTKYLISLVSVMVLTGCAGENEPEIVLQKIDYSEANWPFGIDGGTLHCYPGEGGRLYVVLEVGGTESGRGREYGLNGSAKQFGGYLDVEPLLKPGKVGADLQPFIQRGLALCKQAR